MWNVKIGILPSFILHWLNKVTLKGCMAVNPSKIWRLQDPAISFLFESLQGAGPMPTLALSVFIFEDLVVVLDIQVELCP